jgi:hypothetical protein
MARQAGADNSLLAMALVGYEAAKAKIDAAITEIQAKLGHRGPGRPRAAATDRAAPAKRVMTAAGRKRIAAAQRKRWAAVKKGQAQGKRAAKPTAPKKRQMSAGARKRIGDATRKRWAAYRKAGGKKARTGAAS